MSHRSFEEFWQDIKKLKDKDVYTLRHHRKSRITGADEITLYVRPESSKYSHPMTKGAFETVWRILTEKGEYVPVDDGGYYFVCACLVNLPEVDWLNKNGVIHVYLK
jgi:hypothetical protein